MKPCHFSPQGLDVLSDYFHADGAGLPTETMQSSTKRLRRILTLFNASTRELAQLYWRAWDRRQRSASTVKGPVTGGPETVGPETPGLVTAGQVTVPAVEGAEETPQEEQVWPIR